MKNLTILFLTTLMLSGCYSYHSEPEVQGDIPQEKLKGQGLGFETIYNEVLAKNCVGCHSQYEDYASVRRELDDILDSVKFDRMPKRSGPLPQELKQLLVSWAEQGAPEVPEEPPPPIEPVELIAEWDSIALNIIVPKCQVCHNPNGEAKFLDLSSRQKFFEKRNDDFFGVPFLDFENPMNSYLMQVINDEFEPMPPIDSNIEQLTAEEKQILAEWIGLGLP